MVGAAYASVPLYNLFCRVTGYDGTPLVGTTAPTEVLERTVIVRFDTNVASGLDWSFVSETPQIEAKIGETQTFLPRANDGRRASTGIASYNVQPGQAGAYFVKLKCFCFDDQTLKPGEAMDFPVVFYVDPAIKADTTLDGLSTITLVVHLLHLPQRAAGRDRLPRERKAEALGLDPRRALALGRKHPLAAVVQPLGAPHGTDRRDQARLPPRRPEPVAPDGLGRGLRHDGRHGAHHEEPARAGLKMGPYVLGAGFLGVLYVMASWWTDVTREAGPGGNHTRVVQLSHRYGMIMFIASEVMFFVAWFWAYFDAALYPADPSRSRARSSSARGRRRASRRSIPGTCRSSTP